LKAPETKLVCNLVRAFNPPSPTSKFRRTGLLVFGVLMDGYTWRIEDGQFEQFPGAKTSSISPYDYHRYP